MKQFNEIYEENKKLDTLFETKFGCDNLIIRKNMLSLLVEIGELANETRCFKYWSKKGSSDKDEVLEEYADCMLLTLAFCNYLDVLLDEEFNLPSDYEINEQFIYLYQLCAALPDNYSKEQAKLILVNLIELGKLLSFSDLDIIEACMKKIQKNFERLDDNSNY